MTETYRDQVTVRVVQIRDLIDDEVLAALEIVISPRGTIDLDWLNDEIEAVFHTETGGKSFPVVESSYRLRQTRTETHWGAAGATAEFIAHTAAMIGTIGATTVITLGFESLIEKLQERGYQVRHGVLEALSTDDAARTGLQAIESTFGAPVTSLTLRSVGMVGDLEYKVVVTGPEGTRYTVSFVVRGGETIVRTMNLDLADEP